MLSGFRVHFAAILISLAIIGVYGDRLIEVIEGPFKIAFGEKYFSPSVIRDRVPPIQRQSLVEIGEGQVKFLFAQIEFAPVNVGIEKFLIQRNGLVVIRQGLLQLALSRI